jgi:hypothetical protein
MRLLGSFHLSTPPGYDLECLAQFHF